MALSHGCFSFNEDIVCIICNSIHDSLGYRAALIKLGIDVISEDYLIALSLKLFFSYVESLYEALVLIDYGDKSVVAHIKDLVVYILKFRACLIYASDTLFAVNL